MLFRSRDEHFAQVRSAFLSLEANQTVLLFCHDPTALPFLWRDAPIRDKAPQIEQTIIGHLHSKIIFWKSGLLAGMPKIGFLGHTTKRLSAALNEARHWKAFKVRLCPALGGIELTKGGGYLTANIDPDGSKPARFEYHRVSRSK